MAERLERMAAEVEPLKNPYLSSARLDSALNIEPPAELSRRVTFQANVAQLALHVGRIEEAITRFEDLASEERHSQQSRGGQPDAQLALIILFPGVVRQHHRQRARQEDKRAD